MGASTNNKTHRQEMKQLSREDECDETQNGSSAAQKDTSSSKVDTKNQDGSSIDENQNGSNRSTGGETGTESASKLSSSSLRTPRPRQATGTSDDPLTVDSSPESTNVTTSPTAETPSSSSPSSSSSSEESSPRCFRGVVRKTFYAPEDKLGDLKDWKPLRVPGRP